MKKLRFHLLQLIYGLWLVVAVSGCSWEATPTPLPTPTPEPPPPGKIVFVSTRDGYLSREIYMMDTDGSNQINLTQHPADDYDPAWAPDGQHIIFTSRRYRRGQLFVMDVETRETHRLKGPIALGTNVDILRADYQAAWSPDGQWIAYTSSTLGGETDIFKIRRDGTEETQLTNYRAPDVQPTWSPDGSQITFVSWRMDDPNETFLSPKEKNIFIMNVDGSNVKRFTDDRETENESPLWSQDGQWIVYTAMREPAYSTIMLIQQDLVTQKRQQLLQTSYRDMTSDQSPDGEWLVFDGRLAPERYLKICFIQITGQNYQCLAPPGIYPRWQPLAITQ